jgi:AraC family transcriptional regulator
MKVAVSRDAAPVQYSEEVLMDMNMQSGVASTEQLYDFATSLAKILEAAETAIEIDQDRARRLMTRASSLVQVQIDRHEAPAGKNYELGRLAGWQVKRVCRFIDEHLTETIRLNDLSAVAQRSTAYFCRAFKRTFGDSPHSYLIGRRVKFAGDLMLGSDAPLSEIALASGFADQSHFCRHFRQVMGQTPAAWRRERSSA